MKILRWYIPLVLACFFAGFSGGFHYYVTHYRVWSDLAAEAAAIASEQKAAQ